MDFALYFHWPFCESKCPYCDFNSHVRDHIDHDAWEKAYLAELNYWAHKTKDRCVSSIFFGGGTPSLMKPELAQKLIKHVKNLWQVTDNLEITLEANPSSFEIDRFESFKEAGINRVSIGVQSLRDDVLQFLERPHNADEAKQAVEKARSIFPKFSFDLIYGHPLHTPQKWEAELKEWVTLTKGHLSAYQLTIEPATAFATRYKRGDFEMPDDEAQADFYTITRDVCKNHGLAQYEVSNYAALGHESRHNLTYWQMNDYIGIGPGAHGRITLDDTRYATVGHKAPEIWLDRVKKQGHGGHPFVTLCANENREEKIMMGLRMNKGVDVDTALMKKAIPMIEAGYLIADNNHLRASEEGRLRLNAVINRLLSA